MVKKKYSIEWANGQVVSIAVDGERYDSLDQIPDRTDRAEVQKRIAKARHKNKKSSPARSINGADNFSKYFAMGFLAISILMFGIMAFAIQFELRKQAREKRAPGLVVLVLAGEGTGGELVYVPSVEFALPNGNRQMFQISEAEAPDREASPEGNRYQKNQAVSVIYDPANPSDARLNSGSVERWILPGITGFLGFSFLIPPLIIGWLGRSKARSR
jgi:Protein of unknown function (DUF3592)